MNISAEPDVHPTRPKLTPRRIFASYLELSKARLGALVVLTAFVGYVLGARGHLSLGVGLAAVAGTALSAFGANILNQWWEVERDRLMHRTKSRPLPSGRVDRRVALAWGLLSTAAGLSILALGTNLLTTGLSLFVILLYVVVYTPLKVRTPLNTVIGAICGAIPPMMGWAAATGRLDAGAWILGGILFVWQIPHFLALAWMYRDDYELGGFRMLPDGGRGRPPHSKTGLRLRRSPAADHRSALCGRRHRRSFPRGFPDCRSGFSRPGLAVSPRPQPTVRTQAFSGEHSLPACGAGTRGRRYQSLTTISKSSLSKTTVALPAVLRFAVSGPLWRTDR